MVMIRPFCALRPQKKYVKRVAALPYDVYNRQEAREAARQDPLSFLNIDRPETQFPPDMDIYADVVYDKARELLEQRMREGVFIRETQPSYYIWSMMMEGREQNGLVALSSVDDYLEGRIRRHELTRKEKEEDRFRHIDTTSCQTGPVFLAYRADRAIRKMIREKKQDACLYDFFTADGIRHRVWRIDEKRRIRNLTEAFVHLPCTYIADGHHRAASAVAVSEKRRQEHPEYPEDAEYNSLLSVLFPDDELRIMDYNRLLKHLNGHSREEMLQLLAQAFEISPRGIVPFHPKEKGEFGFYLDHQWYRLKSLPALKKNDPIGRLDVEYLQREALKPFFGIGDPRSDPGIDFVGGIRGLKELELRCEKDAVCAFSLFPTSMEELFAAADAHLLMPPKSTWFEPKLRSGIFLHEIER